MNNLVLIISVIAALYFGYKVGEKSAFNESAKYPETLDTDIEVVCLNDDEYWGLYLDTYKTDFRNYKECLLVPIGSTMQDYHGKAISFKVGEYYKKNQAKENNLDDINLDDFDKLEDVPIIDSTIESRISK